MQRGQDNGDLASEAEGQRVTLQEEKRSYIQDGIFACSYSKFCINMLSKYHPIIFLEYAQRFEKIAQQRYLELLALKCN